MALTEKPRPLTPGQQFVADRVAKVKELHAAGKGKGGKKKREAPPAGK